MAVPLLICTKKEHRAVVNFLWAEGVKGVEIDRCLSAHCEERKIVTGYSFAA
jgi:hypothetical protein